MRKITIRTFFCPFRISEIRKNKKQNELLGFFGLLFTITLLLSVLVFRTNLLPLLKISILDIAGIPFGGTVNPIKKVPNWVTLSSHERTLSYSELPENKFIPIPDYQPHKIARGYDWSQASKYERNAFITYPVPYMGNYELDGSEYSGSHLAVDIKAPKGTPIHAISDGIIYDTGISEYGFGKFVLIAHTNVPEIENPEKKDNFLSLYAHMDSFNVKKGDKVAKDFIIGTVGKTGSATNYHLHFQIERMFAPFHPYWPFLQKDLNQQGINSIFEGVRQGLGKENALKYSIHPMSFVDKFENYKASNTQEAVITIAKVPPQANASASDKPNSAADTSNNHTRSIIEKSAVEILLLKPYIVNKATQIGIKIHDFSQINDTGLNIFSKPRKGVLISSKNIPRENIHENIIIIDIKPKVNDMELIVSGSFGSIKQKLSPHTPIVNEKPRPLRNIKPITETGKNSHTTATKNSNLIFNDIPRTHKNFKAIQYLYNKKIIKGYADKTFRPEAIINRVESLKTLLVANKKIFKNGKTIFTDITQDTWFSPSVFTALEAGIVNGYPDNTFRPGNNISRAEFLKIALKSFEVRTPTTTESPYIDIPKNTWFTPYFVTAKKLRLLETTAKNTISPDKPITRIEAAAIIYKLLMHKAS